MTTAVDRLGVPDAAALLDFSTALDPALVHRRHSGEVFLADARAVGDGAFVAAALAPTGHPQYAGLTGAVGRPADLLALLECCRQAETYAAHAFFGVPRDCAFVLRDWSAELSTDPVRGPAAGPAELLITAVAEDSRAPGGAVSTLAYEFGLWSAGARVGTVRMSVGYLGPRVYGALRARRRGGPPRFSDASAAQVGGRPVEPAEVGRLRATDTVLLDPAPDLPVGRAPVTARLRVPVENTSYFDHPHDHVPGMVLAEAARQLATLAAARWGDGAPERTALTALDSSFTAYAELDAPIVLTATLAAANGPAAPADGSTRTAVEVTFHQQGERIARCGVVLAVAGPSGAAR
jgi:hypothetical protein